MRSNLAQWYALLPTAQEWFWVGTTFFSVGDLKRSVSSLECPRLIGVSTVVGTLHVSGSALDVHYMSQVVPCMYITCPR
jgi:hypothetical protein